MKKIYYEINNNESYTSLNAIKNGLIETGRFTLVSEDELSASNESTATSKKVILKYQGISENIVLTETSSYCHYMKFQSGQVFVESAAYASLSKICHVVMFEKGFLLIYGRKEGTKNCGILAAFETEGKKIIFTIQPDGEDSKISIDSEEAKSMRLQWFMRVAGIEDDKVGYTPLLYAVEKSIGYVLQTSGLQKIYQAVGTAVFNSLSLISFESGKRFLILPGEKRLMVSLDGELL